MLERVNGTWDQVVRYAVDVTRTRRNNPSKTLHCDTRPNVAFPTYRSCG